MLVNRESWTIQLDKWTIPQTFFFLLRFLLCLHLFFLLLSSFPLWVILFVYVCVRASFFLFHLLFSSVVLSFILRRSRLPSFIISIYYYYCYFNFVFGLLEHVIELLHVSFLREPFYIRNLFAVVYAYVHTLRVENFIS